MPNDSGLLDVAPAAAPTTPPAAQPTTAPAAAPTAAPTVAPATKPGTTAANTLTLRGLTLVSSVYPCTQRALEAAGIVTRAVEVSELHKAEAALTCMSLLLEPAAALNSP